MKIDRFTYNSIISIGKTFDIDNIFIEVFLPNFPTLKGSEDIFKINKANAYRYINKDVEYFVKGLHLIEELYKKETKNNFGFGSPSPTFKLIESYSKSNFSKAVELEYWIAKNGGNYYIKPYANGNFKSRLKIHLKVHKAYNYYYAVIENLDIERLVCSNGLLNNFVECIVPNKTDRPNYLTQANSNVLINKTGILVVKDVFKILIEKYTILNDFDTFYFYQLYNSINDSNRYDKDYSLGYEINRLKKNHKIEEQVSFEDSEWMGILNTNPDLFIAKQNNKIFIACKDYKMISNFS